MSVVIRAAQVIPALRADEFTAVAFEADGANGAVEEYLAHIGLL
jgi:hypothetical protein